MGLATDRTTGTVYLFTSDSLIDVGSKNEDKDVWRVYMDMQVPFRRASSRLRNADVGLCQCLERLSYTGTKR